MFSRNGLNCRVGFRGFGLGPHNCTIWGPRYRPRAVKRSPKRAITRVGGRFGSWSRVRRLPCPGLVGAGPKWRRGCSRGPRSGTCRLPPPRCVLVVGRPRGQSPLGRRVVQGLDFGVVARWRALVRRVNNCTIWGPRYRPRAVKRSPKRAITRVGGRFGRVGGFSAALRRRVAPCPRELWLPA